MRQSRVLGSARGGARQRPRLLGQLQQPLGRSDSLLRRPPIWHRHQRCRQRNSPILPRTSELDVRRNRGLRRGKRTAGHRDSLRKGQRTRAIRRLAERTVPRRHQRVAARPAQSHEVSPEIHATPSPSLSVEDTIHGAVTLWTIERFTSRSRTIDKKWKHHCHFSQYATCHRHINQPRIRLCTNWETSMSDTNRRISDQLSHTFARIVDRFAETYCGPTTPEKLKWRWRFANSLAGSSVLYILSVPFSQMQSYIRLLQNTQNSKFVLSFDIASSVMILIVPTILSLVMASGIRNGGPMRFFFSAFFVTAMMLGVASLVHNPQAVLSVQGVSVPIGQGGYVPGIGGGYVPAPDGRYGTAPDGDHVPDPARAIQQLPPSPDS